MSLIAGPVAQLHSLEHDTKGLTGQPSQQIWTKTFIVQVVTLCGWCAQSPIGRAPSHSSSSRYAS